MNNKEISNLVEDVTCILLKETMEKVTYTQVWDMFQIVTKLHKVTFHRQEVIETMTKINHRLGFTGCYV